jgi:hypothetical protein
VGLWPEVDRPDLVGGVQYGMADGIGIKAGEGGNRPEVLTAPQNPLPRFEAWIIRPAVPPILF